MPHVLLRRGIILASGLCASCVQREPYFAAQLDTGIPDPQGAFECGLTVEHDPEGRLVKWSMSIRGGGQEGLDESTVVATAAWYNGLISQVVRY